jgi:hypothetical protein
MSLIRSPGRRAGSVLAATVVHFVFGGIGSAQAPQYHAEFLGPAVNAAAMNASGSVVGTTTIGGAQRGWIAGPGRPLTALPLPPGYTISTAADINDAGVIVGSVTSNSPAFSGQAVAWVPAGDTYTITLLGKLPGHKTSGATALNDVGDIVGNSSTGTFILPVLFTAPGGVQDLSATGIFNPTSINDQRVLVDSSFVCQRLDLDTMVVESLGVPAAPPTYVATNTTRINALGQVAGIAILATSTNCDRVAARFTDGLGWQVFSGCGVDNGAYDLNVHGDVVMKLNVDPYVRFEGLGTFKIEDLIVAGVGHWYVINGYGIAINDARQIVVPATNDVTGQGGLILLTPKDFLCQPNLGHAGPGHLALSVCGGDLSSGTDADLRMTGAPSGALTLLVASASSMPTPFQSGTLVPVPIQVAVLLNAGPDGGILVPDIAGGSGPFAVYAQAVCADPAVAGAIAISNAVRIDFLP